MTAADVDARVEGRAAAATLVDHKERLAAAITERLYEDMPELGPRYGEEGRAKCLQDLHYTLEHLAPAVAMGSPAMFAGYAHWLDELLRARSIPTTETARSLELTIEVIEEQLPTRHAALVRRCVDAGLSVLQDGRERDEARDG